MTRKIKGTSEDGRNYNYYHSGHRSLKSKAANFRLTAENPAGSEEEYKNGGALQWKYYISVDGRSEWAVKEIDQ